MRTRLLSAPLILAALLVLGCDKDDTIEGGCSGNVATATQAGTNINATGSFGGGQPIIRLTQNGVNHEIPATNYDNGTASFNTAGLSKGQYTVTWIISCFNGDGEGTMTSTVTSIFLN